MNCENKVTYVLRRGDTLYHIARFFQTSVDDIIYHNPGINPYNLKIGDKIIICPGTDFMVCDDICDKDKICNCEPRIKLKEDMREVWIQHVYWTRMLLISIAERLSDEPDVAARLLKNPADIANIFKAYYPNDADLIQSLLTEHLEIGAKLITALRDDNSAEAEELQRQWFINADKMAIAFSKINPFYDFNELIDMLYDHLNLTTQEVQMRLQGNYVRDIQAFNKVEQEALSMADYFTAGIIKQFPQKFN